ncbi:MAG: hypothetical protein ILO10_08780 [Kiritimatiellae bacterium]|nr:hypothetical protein [Kiritimatiellia bacterium]
MKTSSLLRILAASVLLAGLAGCEHGGNGLPYKEAEHYFLRNDVNGRNVPTKITTQTEFDRYFGMAAVMGGQPTAIDFDRQFVIAIVLPETNHSTTIRPGTLTDEGGALKLEYAVSVAAGENTWTAVPLSLLVVDKRYERENVVLLRKE